MELAPFIDHTNLKPDALRCDIIKLCREAVEWKFASVCVNPCNVSLAAECLRGSGVKVCCVAGFPLGAGTTESKVYEARLAALHGASEIDMVINVSWLKDGLRELVKSDIEAVVASVPQCTVKVILETCLLNDAEITGASLIAKEAGAHFVKTSTGFSNGGAVACDIRRMREAVGPDMGVKASGGIKDYDSAVAMIEAGANRLGLSKSVSICEEGVSRNSG